MNRYILIRRLRGPAILLLLGVCALLHQAGVTPMWKLFVPLLLILLGVLQLAERMTLAAEMNNPSGPPPGGPYPDPNFPGAPYQGGYQGGYSGQPGVPYQGAPYQGPAGTAAPGSAIVPANQDDFERDPNGGKS
jgi:amino acid transporter